MCNNICKIGILAIILCIIGSYLISINMIYLGLSTQILSLIGLLVYNQYLVIKEDNDIK